jgi:monomeric isocitrate dehydrogenase
LQLSELIHLPFHNALNWFQNRTSQFQLALYWLHSFPEQSFAASLSPPTAYVVQNHNNAEKKHNSSQVGDGEKIVGVRYGWDVPATRTVQS